MFEIGSSLRERRERQQLELSTIEQATRIRAKYLSALEDERFDLLPDPAYAKGFLRTYADYLGLDAQRFVDEYNSRFAPEEEAQAVPAVRVRRQRSLLDPRYAAIPIAALLALIGWRLASMSGRHLASSCRAEVGAAPRSFPRHPFERSPARPLRCRPRHTSC